MQQEQGRKGWKRLRPTMNALEQRIVSGLPFRKRDIDRLAALENRPPQTAKLVIQSWAAQGWIVCDRVGRYPWWRLTPSGEAVIEKYLQSLQAGAPARQSKDERNDH